ncbi:hypothetical protein P9112_014219 [Eukaryota sp. TZLM1-RC]
MEFIDAAKCFEHSLNSSRHSSITMPSNKLIPRDSATNIWKADPGRRPRDFRTIPSDPEAIPPTKLSKGIPPFYGPPQRNDLGIPFRPRIGPYLPDECITENDTKSL